MTLELRVNWRLDDDITEMDTVKVLFEHCREHVVERVHQALPLANELLLTTDNSPADCPYDISRIVDPSNPVSFVISVDSQCPSQQEQRIELFAEDIDSFSQVRNVKPQEVRSLLPLDLSEDEIQTFLENIIGENFHRQDWGGELCDLFTSQILVGGRRVSAAFLLKGNGTKGRLTISKCGKNGDQIVRLLESPAELYIVQHVDDIDERVISDLKGKVQLRIHKGDSCQMCVINGTDTARILKAYGKM